jgi:L-lactate dehydrogenase complex protein LldE
MFLKVGLFVTCLVDLMRPRIGFAALKLLESAGCEVVVPTSQTCCGQPGYNSGDRPAAQALALKVLREFDDCDYVVSPSGSCGGMIRAHYAELLSEFPQHADAARRLAAKTYELTDFLVNIAKLDDVPGRFPGTITYHDSCSGLRELGVKTQPRALLAKVPGLELKEMTTPEYCCGFGGTFAVKFPELSTAMVDHKLSGLDEDRVDVLTAVDGSCLMQLRGRLQRRGSRVLQSTGQPLAGGLQLLQSQALRSAPPHQGPDHHQHAHRQQHLRQGPAGFTSHGCPPGTASGR